MRWQQLGLLLATAASIQAAEQLGRATYYGKDEFSLNDGTCACHKQGLWSSNPCSNNFCFDWIGEKQGKGYGMTAALNTPGKTLTDQCGTCYSVRCVNGPARGTPTSLNPWGACLNNKTVVVMITDSCPCDHPNPTNQKFCCGDTTHFDLSWWAFNEIGNVEQGFMDVMYERLPSCPRASSLGVNRDTCDSYYGIISEQGLWRIAVMLAVSMVLAAVAVGTIIGLVYGARMPFRRKAPQQGAEVQELNFRPPSAPASDVWPPPNHGNAWGTSGLGQAGR